MADETAAGRPPAGRGVIEALVGLAVVGVAVSAAAPAWVGWRDRQRVLDTAWRLVASVEARRVEALRDGRSRGLVFATQGAEAGWARVVDGDGDGIRRADVVSGHDRVTAGPYAWRRDTPGVAPGAGSARAGPGGTRLPADGIAIAGDLVAVAPSGTTSTGTLYLAGPSDVVLAVRWYGVTGRSAVWIREPPSPVWRRIR